AHKSRRRRSGESDMAVPHAMTCKGLVLALLISATVFVIEPLKSVVTNWTEVSIGFGALASELVLPWLCAFVVLAVAGILSTRVLPRCGVAIGIALYLLLWLQSNVLIWSYGPFDGMPLDWGQHAGKGLVEAVIWLSVLAAALLRPMWFERRWLGWVGMIAALQGASLAGHWQEHAPLVAKPEPVINALEADLPIHSSTNNVIVVVLDALQSDFFAQALGDPSFRARVPDGLTYYRNAISVYIHTEFSLQTMLTGRAIPDGVQYEEWADRALGNSVMSRLEERGFEPSFVTGAGRVMFCDMGGITCMVPSELARGGAVVAGAQRRRDVDAMFRLGLFRLVPHAFKRFTYDAGIWRIPSLYGVDARGEVDPRILPETQDDLRIFKYLVDELRVEGAPRFKFLHFRGVHFPATVDSKCAFSAKRSDAIERREKWRERFVGMTHCVGTRLFQYLDALDRVGVYDNSLIFIVSDHGSPVIPVEPSVSRLPVPPAVRGAVPALEDSWRGVPVFLVKPRGARGELRVSDRPVSLCDIPASILDSDGDPGDFPCSSVFADVPDKLTRFHYRYPDRSEQREAGIQHLKRLDFTQYEVRGHSWRPESWQATRP
ncbi:MAG: sulfatase-like hydrolase/transferase, partial [Myxococcota bacterium]|nr:sulfatase-like hydrolase/transferase [Myxococcota bacterium]